MKLSKNNAVELLVESESTASSSTMLFLICLGCYERIRFGFCCLPPNLGDRPLLEHSPRTHSKQLAGIGAGGRLHRCEFGTAAFCRARNRLFGWIK